MRRSARADSPGLTEKTLEQLLAWNTDVLILGGTVEQVERIRSDPRWQQMRAVSTRRVYLNPKGVVTWDRYGPEEVLQIQWAAADPASGSFRRYRY